MPATRLAAAAFAYVFAGGFAEGAPAQAAEPPPILREFRGAWVATVDNIDWPSKRGLPVAELRAELDAIVARAEELRLNAIVFQARPCADAMYASALEPWSEWLAGIQGKAPGSGFDPLQHLLDRAHRRGIEVHAWCNPFRAKHPKSTSATDADHVLRKLPSVCVRHGEYEWMDPGEPKAVEWSLAVFRDLVARYDVDGIHVDDYFYPYPVKGKDFPDDASYTRYRRGGGRLERPAWRRANIDVFVRRMYEETKALKPWVKVGISPFGIARPGVPKGIQAGVDQYETMGADVLRWLAEGWVDYLAPQLYWPIDQKPQSFAVLLPWWHAQNGKRRHVWPGVNSGRAVAGKPPWRSDELAQQIELIRAQSDAPGYVLWSFKSLRSESPAAAGLLQARVHLEPAAVPASPWLGGAAPNAPVAEAGPADRGQRRVRWQHDPLAFTVGVQVLGAGGWRTLAVTGAEAGSVHVRAAETKAVALTAFGRTGLASPRTILSFEAR